MSGTKSWMEIHVMNSIHHVTMSNIVLYDNDNFLIHYGNMCKILE
jgi:hypothetical protein